MSIINIEKIIRGKTCGNFLNAPGYESGSGGSSGGSARVKNGKKRTGAAGMVRNQKEEPLQGLQRLLFPVPFGRR